MNSIGSWRSIFPVGGIILGCCFAAGVGGCAGHPTAMGGEKLPLREGDSGNPSTDRALPTVVQGASDAGATIKIGGATIELDIPQKLPVPMDAVDGWVNRAAVAITQFYGRYPVRHVDITILSESRGRITGGQENQGRYIRIALGARTRPADLAGDWTLTHEMFHLSQPQLDQQYSWMSEGMADYLEPVARVRIGQISPEKFWGDLVEGLPQGLPDAGDKGLDQTPTWARTYWGGCLFWFVADVRIHEQTRNRKSVRDAAQAVLDAGGDGAAEWTMDRLLASYDRGTGTGVFKALHDEMGNRPVVTDLDAMWKALGVKYDNGRVSFDDTAPQAAVRRAMTMP